MSHPQPALELCAEREEIAQSITAVINRLLALGNAEADAVKKGDPQELERIRRELENVTVLKTFLMERFKEHVQLHRCRQPKVLS